MRAVSSADIGRAAARQAMVLRNIEERGKFSPVSDAERATCRALRACGVIRWDRRIQAFVMVEPDQAAA